MKVVVKFFGLARELAGTDSLSLPAPEACSVALLMEGIARDYPRLAPVVENLAVSVNLEYARRETLLKDGDEVALIPPVSGG